MSVSLHTHTWIHQDLRRVRVTSTWVKSVPWSGIPWKMRCMVAVVFYVYTVLLLFL
jgi:hypothetical protein